MRKVIIIHGWEGSSNGDWIPWLSSELTKKGYSVITPDMPNTSRPVISEWVNHLKDLVPEVDENTYFIGHSIGCQTIMRFLENSPGICGGVIYVAGWFNLVNLEGPEAEEIANPWIQTPIDFEKVKKSTGKSVVILGDNDEWVPYEETKKDFAEKLGSEVITSLGSGHMTGDDGFGPFPLLLETFERNFE